MPDGKKIDALNIALVAMINMIASVFQSIFSSFLLPESIVLSRIYKKSENVWKKPNK